MSVLISYTNHRKKWYFSGEGVLVYGKKEDRWLSLITRGMTTQPHTKRTSWIVSFLMVIGIKTLQNENGRSAGVRSGSHSFAGGHGIRHEHRDGHGTDTTGNRSDDGAFRSHRIEINIPN